MARTKVWKKPASFEPLQPRRPVCIVLKFFGSACYEMLLPYREDILLETFFDSFLFLHFWYELVVICWFLAGYRPVAQALSVDRCG